MAGRAARDEIHSSPELKLWKPLAVGIEEYGLMGDIQHIEHLQHQRNFCFRIQPLGGAMSNEDRIRRLLPLFEQGRIILPPSRYRTLYDKSTVNLIDAFVEEEYMAFPVAAHDDMLDALARIEDLHLLWPEAGIYRAGNSDRPTSYFGGQTAGERMRSRAKPACHMSNHHQE